MTCIVGLEHDGKVYMGGDSAGCDSWSLEVRSDVKVFQNKDYLFGFTDSFRMGQILAHCFEPPSPTTKTDTKILSEIELLKFMSSTFIDKLRKCLKSNGYATIKDNVESGGTFLIGVRGFLFKIMGDFQVGRTMCGYDAIGSGWLSARGAMFVLNSKLGDVLNSEQKITMALDTAVHDVPTVRGPYTILDI